MYAVHPIMNKKQGAREGLGTRHNLQSTPLGSTSKVLPSKVSKNSQDRVTREPSAEHMSVCSFHAQTPAGNINASLKAFMLSNEI